MDYRLGQASDRKPELPQVVCCRASPVAMRAQSKRGYDKDVRASSVDALVVNGGFSSERSGQTELSLRFMRNILEHCRTQPLNEVKVCYNILYADLRQSWFVFCNSRLIIQLITTTYFTLNINSISTNAWTHACVLCTHSHCHKNSITSHSRNKHNSIEVGHLYWLDSLPESTSIQQ